MKLYCIIERGIETTCFDINGALALVFLVILIFIIGFWVWICIHS